MPDNGQHNVLSGLIAQINSAQTHLQKSKTQLVRSKGDIGAVRDLTQYYFRNVRPKVSNGGFDLDLLDASFQALHELLNKTSLRSAYLDTLRVAKKRTAELEVQFEFSFSEQQGQENETKAEEADVVEQSLQEKAILNTLFKINPFFADAYQQIILDLNDTKRISYRGVVHEMRELLRGVLNHFAPDTEVVSQDGFQLESGQNKPTRTQKMKFILKSRNQTSAQIDPASKTVRYLDVQTEILSAMPSAIYGAGSESAHAEPRDFRNEVVRLKRYLDANLCDILEIN